MIHLYKNIQNYTIGHDWSDLACMHRPKGRNKYYSVRNNITDSYNMMNPENITLSKKI